MDAHSTILNFRDALNSSYLHWRRSADAAHTHDQEFLDETFGDWAQVHWELLVERVLCQTKQFLSIYDAGSDYEMSAHSRVFFHDAIPTHQVVCQANESVIDLLSKQNIDLKDWEFDKFVSFTDSWYNDCPPFDNVLLSNTEADRQAVVAIGTVIFELQPIEQRNRNRVRAAIADGPPHTT